MSASRFIDANLEAPSSNRPGFATIEVQISTRPDVAILETLASDRSEVGVGDPTLVLPISQTLLDTPVDHQDLGANSIDASHAVDDDCEALTSDRSEIAVDDSTLVPPNSQASSNALVGRQMLVPHTMSTSHSSMTSSRRRPPTGLMSPSATQL